MLATRMKVIFLTNIPIFPLLLSSCSYCSGLGLLTSIHLRVIKQAPWTKHVRWMDVSTLYSSHSLAFSSISRFTYFFLQLLLLFCIFYSRPETTWRRPTLSNTFSAALSFTCQLYKAPINSEQPFFAKTTKTLGLNRICEEYRTCSK